MLRGEDITCQKSVCLRGGPGPDLNPEVRAQLAPSCDLVLPPLLLSPGCLCPRETGSEPAHPALRDRSAAGKYKPGSATKFAAQRSDGLDRRGPRVAVGGMCLTPWTAALQKSGWHQTCLCLQRVTEKKVVGTRVSCLNTADPCANTETLKLLETGIRAPINTAVLQNSYYTTNPSQRLGRPKR